jgi:cation transport regulator
MKKNKIAKKGAIVPYYSNKDLPKNISDVLPEHAQDIFRTAFNSEIVRHNGHKEIAQLIDKAIKK